MNEVSTITMADVQSAQPIFIPVSRTDIFDALLSPELWASSSQQAQATDVLRLIGMIRQHQSAETLNLLSDIYDPFNPDDETVNIAPPSETERLEKRRLFNAKLKDLISSANYRELSSKELEDILTSASPDGVHVDVDFQEYEVKLMYYRGESEMTKRKRNMLWLYLKHKQYNVPIFERLFLAIKFKPVEQRIQEIMQAEGLNEAKARKKLSKLRRMLPPSFSTDHIYIKVFKAIPRLDVEMLFPNIRVKMKYTDKLQLGGSAVFGVVTWAVGTASKLLVAVALSPMMLAGALATGVGSVMYAQIRNIFITRDRYRMQLAQSLYFQNLANNQGALALMVDEAEEEDVKEEALLYVHLLRTPVHATQLDNLRSRINAFLSERFEIDVHFDIYDALSRLRDMGLVTQSPAGDVRAIPLEEARRHLHDRLVPSCISRRALIDGRL
ncbi:MAG: DUF3754 domain-containing protein [Rhodomicrobium sp.]|nr:DUF3754 domain-containing protein [Rhodomicrobium sp.]